MKLFSLPLGIFLAVLLLSSSHVRAEAAGVFPVSAEVQILEPVIVTGKSEEPAAQEIALERSVIQQLPAGNGSISELLHLLPGIQLGEDYKRSTSGGEILPPTLSISGGKIYQNNFLIDGVANNNIIDPALKWGADNINDTPGHPQERFLTSDLVERVTLYDSNVPARFGGFSGGVVDAVTRDPERKFAGHLAYRTTRSQWTQFHIADDDQKAFSEGGRETTDPLHPKFSKNDYAVTLNFPLSEKSGLLASWHQIDSTIPLPYLGASREQKRQLQSYFLKYVNELSADNRVKFTFNSTPYREEHFSYNVLNSDYLVKMEALSAQGDWQHVFAAGDLQIVGSYRRSSNGRSGPQDLRAWLATDSKDWGRLVGAKTSTEGGFGAIEKIQESFDLKSLLHLEPIYTGNVRHELTTGFELNRTAAGFERPVSSYAYNSPQLSSTVLCGGDDYDCVEKEQFFSKRMIYPAGKSRSVIQQVGLHGEDLLLYHRLELRPGFRFDYNDLMEEINLSPRFLASYDLFGSGATIFRVGANRYYGTTLLTYKLREAKIPFRSESRGVDFNNNLTPWTAATAHGISATRFSSLQTPYADELSIGLDQRLAGGVLNLEYVRREGRDEFSRTYSPVEADGFRYYTLNNYGQSHHERYSLAWERNWLRHYLSFNASWQETTTTNEDYDTTLLREEINDQIWYNGELIYKGDLPSRTQNRPIIANLIWVAELPARFTFTNLSHYRSGYREIVETKEIIDNFSVYEEVRHPGRVIFDWKLGWSTPIYRQQLLACSLEINNVFNARTQTGGTTTTYEMGRQFWAGIAYDF